MVSQEVPQLSGGEHAAVAGIMSEHGVQLRPPQQLPAELLDLYGVKTTVPGSVTPLGHRGELNRQTHTEKYANISIVLWLLFGSATNSQWVMLLHKIRSSCANLH